MAGKTLFCVLVLASVSLTGFGSETALHLGREPGKADAVASNAQLDRHDPRIEVKVTNRQGEPALLAGWLDGRLATAEVPARSAIVTLRWKPMEAGPAQLVLRLYSGANARPSRSESVDEEHHRLSADAGSYYYATPSPSVPPQVGTPSPSVPPQVGTPPPSVPPLVGTPPPSVPAELPVTGSRAGDHIGLGAGMVILGAAGVMLAAMASRRWPRLKVDR